MENKIAVLPGDGIGPEIIAAAVRVLKAIENVTIIRSILHSVQLVAVQLTNSMTTSTRHNYDV